MGLKISDQRGCITVEGRQGGRHQEDSRVVTECYCHNGHNLLNDLATFGGYSGISIKLRRGRQDGQLLLSPIIGDLSRTFLDFDRIEGAIVEICCPICDEPLPLYDQCECDAFLATLFTTPREDFANCIGICQRIGCLHSKIISIDHLRKLSRMGFY